MDKDLSKDDYIDKLDRVLLYLKTAKDTLELDRLVTDNPVLSLHVDSAIQSIYTQISSL